VRTVSETVVRCDVCGLLKEREVRGWRTLKLSFHSNEDTNDSNKRRDWSREFQDLCPKCFEMMLKRACDALHWAVTL
jgi:hypothetical protein